MGQPQCHFRTENSEHTIRQWRHRIYVKIVLLISISKLFVSIKCSPWHTLEYAWVRIYCIRAFVCIELCTNNNNHSAVQSTRNFSRVNRNVPNEISVIYYNLVYFNFLFSIHGFSQFYLPVHVVVVNRIVCSCMANTWIHFNQKTKLGAIERRSEQRKSKKKKKLNDHGN